ncbi:MAG: glutamate-1-semialdehyde 2,1-aminomutase [Eubacterium sp.]|nr:glutamate-1-semialdehyde 2,1-aminomutase [Eubacterium sp.]
MEHQKSIACFEEANRVIPGGVNSPVRAFKSVGMPPIFVDHAEGSKLWDVDGNVYTDYICSWGPLILGHASDIYYEGIVEALKKGDTYGAPTAIETALAEMITQAYPSMEMVRMVNSGTEATMSAIRLARGYTGREKFVKFEGCYHGHSDSLLVKSGSGTLTYGVPTSPGVTAGTAKDTLVATYNDLESVKQLFAENPGEIACVIVEPVAGNMGVVAPKQEFLEGLRAITQAEGALLIFDEVITGFRLAYGGAQELFGIQPDLTTLGKIIGGGMPVGAFGGRRDIMEKLAPLGPVYQAGTLSGNPIAMKMGINTLTYLKNNPGVYTILEDRAKQLEEGFNANIEKTGVKAKMVRLGGMSALFFTDQEITDFASVMTSDTEMYSRYFKAMLDLGNLMPPSQFEGIFVSAAHTEADIEKTVADNLEALKTLV